MTSALALTKSTLDVGIVPHDVEAMQHFYSEVLALPVEKPRALQRATLISHAVGTSLLKLLCVDPPPPREEGGIDAAVGYRLLTLVVPDLDGVLARAEQAGVAVERDTFDAGSVQFPLAFLADPDGNALELVGVAGAEPSLQVGMTVVDIERTLHFYRDVLGFDEEPPISWNGIDRRSVRFGDTSLKFWHRGDGLPVRTGSSTERAGIRYVTARVASVADAAATLLDKDVPLPLPPMDVGTGWLCIYADPDGNWTEVLEPKELAAPA
jgi:catechol 2,3-dioxygenase-like lactoylglutathione lyase family enzyme